MGHEGEGDDDPSFGSVGSRKNCQSGGTGRSELERGSVYQSGPHDIEMMKGLH